MTMLTMLLTVLSGLFILHKLTNVMVMINRVNEKIENLQTEISEDRALREQLSSRLSSFYIETVHGNRIDVEGISYN